MPQLISGSCIIASLAQGDGATIGRYPVEDTSLLPKRIVTLPSGFRPSQWLLQALPNGRYVLKNGGSPTAEHDGLLFAYLLDDKQEEWEINYRGNHNAYTIERASGESGWVLPDDLEPETQVALRPLRATMSIPPQFPDSELWKITLLHRDKET
ncbi:hypothetical protein BV22DRAFT_1024464 [Leucogyrophana mollusca]|uniref:Uncharacterized protein n=1 Tax=Leucogyrophana mollusca TaxID=85980 RepID=A0ACB8AYB3_9AGAM|nr:hypothetical protein BV22DRAFT_1024464 [Leucogyrophana mollusca]